MRVQSEAVSVTDEGSQIAGDLVIPPGAGEIVLFAHGSGSSRHSPRNRSVASALQDAGLGTLLMDLLTEHEDAMDTMTGEHRFDIGLLSGRVTAAIDWLGAHPATADLPVGLFGASTGAAAALSAAAERPERVVTVVSRGGRPNLAGDALRLVRCPVLLIVGGDDPEVLQLNREAADLLAVPHRIHIVPGATHLFEEPGALDEVAEEARDWFVSAVEGPGTPS
jgi:putative phosphoribosyl transferase